MTTETLEKCNINLDPLASGEARQMHFLIALQTHHI